MARFVIGVDKRWLLLGRRTLPAWKKNDAKREFVTLRDFACGMGFWVFLGLCAWF